jgi:hypothetical protein
MNANQKQRRKTFCHVGPNALSLTVFSLTSISVNSRPFVVSHFQ